MNIPENDLETLKELCEQLDVNYEKVLQLLKIEKDYDLRDKRVGIFDALKDVLKSGY